MSLEFNSIYPWSNIIRCNVADDVTVNAYFGDSDYIEDGTNGQVMMEIPMFWYKRYKDIPASELANAISPRPKAGFKLHPMFTHNGEIQTKVYYGAFLASFYDVSESAYADYYVGNATPNTDGDGDADGAPSGVTPDTTATSGDKLASVAGRFPLTKLTRASFRTLAQNRGSRWSLVDYSSLTAVQLLQMIELGSIDGQTALGMGVVSKTGTTHYKAEETGTTAYTLASPNYGEATGLYHMMYRGIEDLWGNCWQWIDGININFTTVVDTADTPIPYWCNNTANYADNTTTNYEDLGIVLSGYPSIGGSGYIKNIHATPDWSFLPSEHQASVGYFRDYWYPSSGAGWRVLLSGGYWDNGGLRGPFTLSAGSSSADARLYRSSRLLCY